MNKIKPYFDAHKSESQPLKARSELWSKIENGLEEKKDNRAVFWIRMLASAAAILAIGFFIWTAQPSTETVQMAEMNVFPDICLNTPEGEPCALSTVKGKVILVNFWASWDEVCNENNCYVFKPMYEKYKEHGFTIYGVSIDSDKNAWVSSIEEDQLSWVQVSDLKGWDSPVAKLLNIEKLPTSFLVDEELKIIAKDLDADELEETLSKLLAYK